MRIKFYLKIPQSETETAIFCRVSFDAKQVKAYTGLSIIPKYWNPKTHRAKNTPTFREGSSLNVRLDKIQSMINKIWLDYQNEQDAKPSFATFRHLIDVALGRTKQEKLNLFEYFSDFIDRTKKGQRVAKGRVISASKAKHYATTLNKLKEFAETWSKRLDFDSIDLDFYQDFTGWLRSAGYAENNVGIHIQNLKAVLNEATERNVNKNLSFRSKLFTKTSEEVDNIVLTESELQELQKLDLSDSPHLGNVRDLFLIGCYTGLRYSDFSRLKPEDITGGFIEIKQQKTGNSVAIPVHPVVAAVLKKYKGKLPEAISNQKTNDYLKEVCKLVKCLDVPASKTRTQGGMKVTTNYRKWQIVTTHTARRTFATNAYLQKIQTLTIMAVTGHKTEKAFLKYIKVTPKEHARIMADVWARRSKLKITK